MKLHRIWAVILRYNFLFKHSLDRQVDAFYWPTVDLVLWGVTSSYLASQTRDISFLLLMVVSGIVLWTILYRGQYEFTVNILEEVWNKNLINMFVSPLKLSEWITAFSLLGLTKAIASSGFAAIMAFLLYKTHIFAHGFSLLPFLFLLLMTGWCVGLMVGGLILRFGTRVQIFAWGMVSVIAPFSAVYYPLAALPAWAQKIALIVPSSYVFEGSRQVIAQGTLDWQKVIMAFSLNVLYLALAAAFFKSSFKKVLDRGLVKFQ